MSKSIKFKTDTYLDSTSVVHNRKNLSNILTDIGRIYTVNNSNIYCKQSTATELCSITLPPGLYVVVSTFRYDDSVLSYHFTLAGRALSAYDDSGWVQSTISNIVGNENQSVIINCLLWPRNKSITVNGADITAIRIK